MKRIFITLFIMIVATGTLFSQFKAVVMEVAGKVEIKEPDGRWQPAKTGMSVTKGMFISTGFRSEAKLELDGGPVLWVKQLTRMQIEELVRREGTQTTELFLRVGKVRADVKSVEGLRHDFKLRSPVSTAAVRGTVIEYDGDNLDCLQGIATMSNLVNQTVTVFGGEGSQTAAFTMPLSGEEKKEIKTEVNPFTSSTGSAAAATVEPEPPTTAIVTIEIEYQ